METLTRLVSESLARHGFDRPLDYRRLQWSQWFRCECHHSLLVVPSRPGVFALAEEVIGLGATTTHVDTAASPAAQRGAEGALPRTPSEAKASGSVAIAGDTKSEIDSRHMLAVSQFFEDDDMAFVLDRMLSNQNPMRARLASGRYFVRYVVIEDPSQRRNVCNALNQWILSSSERTTGICSHFAASLENTAGSAHSSRTHRADNSDAAASQQLAGETRATAAPRLNSAVPTTIHCSSSFPSGF